MEGGEPLRLAFPQESHSLSRRSCASRQLDADLLGDRSGIAWIVWRFVTAVENARW
jgi:hypothetical protein